MEKIYTFVIWASAIYVAFHHLLNLTMVIGAVFEIRRQRRASPQNLRRLACQSGLLPGITVVIPAYNEQRTIARTVFSVLAADYPDFEVIVVNDGSTDRTLGVLWETFELAPTNDLPEPALQTQAARAVFKSRADPRLRVVDKRNSGKADALNTGINWSTRKLVCAIDADVVLDRHALADLALPFAEDHEVMATSGRIRPINESGGWIQRLQALEYLRAFNVGRMFFNQINAHLIISGALGLFRRSALLEAGGYQVHAIGEDMELVVRMSRRRQETGRPCRMVFVADAVCFTEVPGQLGELGRQRTRWHQGLLTTLRLHRKMLFNKRYGSAGLVSFPYFFFFELLSPFMEFLGWIVLATLTATGSLGWDQALPFLTAALVLPATVSAAAILIDALEFRGRSSAGQRLMLLCFALVEPLGYHQTMLFFRLRAFLRYYRSVHLRPVWRPPIRPKVSQ